MPFHLCVIYDIPDVLHLLRENFTCGNNSTAETIGSVIKNHGCKNRSSLLPKTLSNEVKVTWNGPSEFSHLTTSLIKESLDKYFKKSQTGMRFYVRTRLALMSTIIADFMKKCPRIQFD